MKRCSSCNGAFHPATGHQWSSTMRLCWNCTLELIKWLKQRERAFDRPWRKPLSNCSFNEAALTSIRPEENKQIRKIRIIDKCQPLIDPKEVAEALGAEIIPIGEKTRISKLPYK
jgi:hypothetical protein